MKTYHVYHHFDADGFGAAAVLNRFYLNDIILSDMNKFLEQNEKNDEDINEDDVQANVNCLYYPCGHNEPMDLSEIQDGDVVFILDYSFSRKDDQEALKALAKRDCYVVWIDHHDTSKQIIDSDPIFQKYANHGIVYTGSKFSGAMLTYIWCESKLRHIGEHICNTPNEIITAYFDMLTQDAPMWVKLISDHDTFTHEIEGSSEFCLAVTHYGLKEVFLTSENCCYSDNDHPDDQETERYLCDGKLLFEYQQRQNAKLFKRAGYRVNVLCTDKKNDDRNIYRIACFNGYGNSFVFGDTFAEVDACAIFNFDGTAWRFSLFSKDLSLCDCGQFATMFGELYQTNGGGHIHAAGWSAPVNVFEPDFNVETDEIIFTVKAI